MARPLLLAAALVVTVVVMAVALAPASIADARLAQSTDGALRLSDAEGTVWNGSGFLVAGTNRLPLAWRIDPWPLVRGELQVHVGANDVAAARASPRGDFALRRDYVELRNAELSFPASLLNSATGPAAAWVVGGDIDVSATALEWSPPANRGDARVRWRGARLIAPGAAAPLELGDVSWAPTGEGDRLAGPVSNIGGDLAIRGDIALGAASGVRLALVLTPRRADNRDLAQALSMLGPREGDGWRVDWRLPLR